VHRPDSQLMEEVRNGHTGFERKANVYIVKSRHTHLLCFLKFLEDGGLSVNGKMKMDKKNRFYCCKSMRERLKKNLN
jgi:hypothetical protein